ncbi:MAG: acyltransferase [Coriobacteriia bacterium]
MAGLHDDHVQDWRRRGGWTLGWELRRWGKVFISRIPAGFGSMLRRRLYGFASCGKDCLLLENVWVEYPEKLSLGEHVNVARGVIINAAGGVEIEDWVLLGPDVIIYSQDHVFDGIDVPISMAPDRRAPIRIERAAWIASRAIITAGVTIGEGAVVGAGAVVTRDVEPFTVVAGVPARVIRTRVMSEEGARLADTGE